MTLNRILSIELRRLAAVLCVTSFLPLFSHAELIPSARLVDWTAGVSVGVPGGIDQYRPGGSKQRIKLINVTLPPYNADKTGSVDAAPAVKAAINAAASGDVVYLPSGTYRFNSGIITGFKDNYTIRGDGPSNTTIKFYGSTLSAIEIGGAPDYEWNWPPGSAGALSGALKGASVIPMADTSEIVIGMMGQISIIDSADPLCPVVHVAYPNGRSRRLKVMVTAKTASTITISPPLAFDIPASLSPRIALGASVVESVGVEDLWVDGATSTTPHPLMAITQGLGCWLYNVKATNTPNYNIAVADSVRCEIRKCTGSGRQQTGTNGAGLLVSTVSSSLFEDNIFGEQLPSIEVNSGTTGCVFAYNFCYDSAVFGGSGGSIDSNHAPHNSYNLYEGNLAPNVQCDGYHGSASDDTVFRNWLHGVADGIVGQFGSEIKGLTVNLNRFTRNYSVVGNILGSTGTPGKSNIYPEPPTADFGMPNGGNFDWTGTAKPSAGDWWASFGTAAGPGGFQELDLDVRASLILKGNYNTENGAIPAGESLGGEALPDSLFRSTKPAYFGSLAWPPFNPESPGNLSWVNANFVRIPAGYRYVNGTDPSGASTSPPPPVPSPTAQASATPAPGSFATPAPGSFATPAQNPTSGGLVLAFGFEESSGASVIDASGNENTGTIKGATRAQGKFGQALRFDGVGNSVRVNQSSSLNASSGITLEAWVCPTADQAGWRTIIQREVVAYWLQASSDVALRPATGGNFGGSESWTPAPSSLPVNGWTHLASTYDGSTLRLYVNGNLVASRTVDGSIQTNSNPLWIGGNAPFGEYFLGLIDEVRIYSRALSQAEIQADMNSPIEGTAMPTPAPAPSAAPTPIPSPQGPTVSGLVAAFGFEEGSGALAFDASGNENAGTLTGATRTSGKFGNALEFNGSSNSVKVNASTSLNLSSAMTLEAWVYPTADQGGWRAIIHREFVAYWLHASSDSGVLRPATGGVFGGAAAWFRAPGAIPVNSWTHLASTYNGITLRLYVNGNSVANRAVTGSIQQNSSPLWIGGNGPFGEYFQGRIDEIRIYNRALSQSEIQADMNASVGP